MATLTAYRGDTFRTTATILTAAGTAFDLTGCTVWFTVKAGADVSADDSTALVRLYWVSGGASSGIAVTTPTLGVAVVTLSPAQMTPLNQYGGYRYDLQVKDSNGDVTTVDSGKLIATNDITLRLTTP